MSEALKWHEAFELMAANQDAPPVQFLTAASSWVNMRVRNGVTQFERDGGNWATWGNLDALIAGKWRRVPKTPSLGELAAKWRARSGIANSAFVAQELEQALAADELVSLKGVRAEDLAAVFRSAGGTVYVGLDAVLDHLRKSVVR